MEFVPGLEQIECEDDDGAEESKLYIADIKPHMLVNEAKVFENADGSIIVGDQVEHSQSEDNEAVEHIIIDGQVKIIAYREDYTNNSQIRLFDSTYNLPTTTSRMATIMTMGKRRKSSLRTNTNGFWPVRR